MRQLTDEFLTNADNAADHFRTAFLHAHAFPEADIGDIEQIKIWPDGTPEP
jgi:hypothetical protein